ncbi:389_t:CDS:1, partial [Cetraspora pellucida]
SLKKTVPRALDSVDLIKVCYFAHCSVCFMSAYELEFTRKAATFA